jgi:hypothetical protein
MTLTERLEYLIDRAKYYGERSECLEVFEQLLEQATLEGHQIERGDDE